MGVAAENAVRTALCGIVQGAFRHLVAQAQPACAETIEPTRDALLLAFEALHGLVKANEEFAEQDVLVDETVELVPVDGKMALAAVLPHIALVDRDADQVRHHIRQAVVVIALNPDDLPFAFRVRKAPNTRKKVPVVALEAAKVEIREDIAQQDELPEVDRFQQLHRVLGPAHVAAKVNVRQDEGVAGLHHAARRVLLRMLPGCETGMNLP
jgi:hypothetical protein